MSMYRVPKRELPELHDVPVSSNGNDDTDIKNLLKAVLRGQQQIQKSLGELEELVTTSRVEILQLQEEVNGIKNKQDKIAFEVDRIGHRSSVIKDLMTKSAAHTLNNARKIHGGYSVQDPVKEFIGGGYKDWSLIPTAAKQYGYLQFQAMYQANGFPVYPQQAAPVTPGHQECAGLSTPVYGNDDTPEKTVKTKEKTSAGNNKNIRYSDNRGSNRQSAHSSRFRPYESNEKSKNDNRGGNHHIPNQAAPTSNADFFYAPSSPSYSS